jgi:TolB-like protein/Tfp pilus assembly protein PilF
MLGTGGAAGDGAPLNSPRRDEILAELDAVLGSSGFDPASRRARLLRYLVERALAGEGENTNEYAIGVDIFGKPPTFDPRMEAGVRTEVGRLRQKLRDYYGDEGSHDRIVLDLPLRSYALSFRLRSLEPVLAEADLAGATVAQVEAQVVQDAAVPLPAPETPAPPRRRGPLVAIVAILLTLAASAGAFSIWRAKRPVNAPIRSLVVLPFQNLSAAQADQYLADGLTDELTNVFVSWKEILVVARTSAYQYKGRGVDVRKIGHELNVDAVLEGSLTKQGDRIHITAQLNRTSDGYHLWSQSYDARSQDMITVEREMAQSIVSAVRKLGGKTPDRIASGFTTSPEALDLFLQASYQYRLNTPESLNKSLSLYHQAASIDPSFTRAFLGIAAAEIELRDVTAGPQKGRVDRERAAVQRALELDPNSGDAHGILALITGIYDWDWPRADREFQLAIDLGARPSIRSSYGHTLAGRGRFSEAFAQCRIAEGLDPLGYAPRAGLYWTAYYEHNYSEARKVLRELLDITGDVSYTHTFLGWIAALEKDCAETTKQFEWVARTQPSYATTIGLAVGSACRGESDKARQYLKEAAASTTYVSPYLLASGYAFQQDSDATISYLQKSVADREYQTQYLKYDPVFDGIRSDPRFIAVEKTAGLQP